MAISSKISEVCPSPTTIEHEEDDQPESSESQKIIMTPEDELEDDLLSSASRSKKGNRQASTNAPRKRDPARRSITNGNISNINYMGNTRKCGNMSNIKNILHEPVTTNRKNNSQSDRSMSRNSNSSGTDEERSEGHVHEKHIRDDDNTAMEPTKNLKNVKIGGRIPWWHKLVDKT